MDVFCDFPMSGFGYNPGMENKRMPWVGRPEEIVNRLTWRERLLLLSQHPEVVERRAQYFATGALRWSSEEDAVRYMLDVFYGRVRRSTTCT